MKILKKLFATLFLCLPYTLFAQIVSLQPATPKQDQEVTIIYDASQGTQGLVGASSVYMHAGVVTSGYGGTSWENVVGNWGKDDGIGKMEKVAGSTDKWQIKITPKTYFKTPDTKQIFRLAMVFRSADGSKEGKADGNQDIFMNIDAGFALFFANLGSQSTDFTPTNKAYKIRVEATKATTNFTLFIDNEQVKTQANSNFLEYETTFAEAGTKKIKVVGVFESETKELSYDLTVINTAQTAELPAGVQDGINYDKNDPTTATLVLFAPKKEFVFVIGDFNDWKGDANSLMKKTPDGNRFWLKLSNLTPKKQYVFQYLVDGKIKIGDPYSDLIVDPFSDEKINFLTDEKTPYIANDALPVFDKSKVTDLATILQTDQTPYEWKVKNFQKPAPENLVIYELLIRDFTAQHDYKTLIDSIPYLKSLGINAVQLMPIMEFENNDSWGYNPSYHLATDKYYGTKDDLRRFIDKCHENGMAVILDMVLNHAFGQSPLVRLYPQNNPYFNTVATHPFNVGNDFNHEYEGTQYFVDRVNAYWLTEFKFDGYRFDLSKGFTQKQSTDDGVFRQYDTGRIKILKRMYDQIRKIDASAYVILEHFAEDREEIELSDYGMMLWNNVHGDYAGAAYRGSGNFSRTYFKNKGWNKNYVVSYMESHDEERQMLDILKNGQSLGSYNIKDLATATERAKQVAAFFYLIPGAKMLWQFGEFGYDISINEGGRLGKKPLKWDYLKDPNRLKLKETVAELIKLKMAYPDVFSNGTFQSSSLSSLYKRMSISSSQISFHVVGNFDLEKAVFEGNFPKTGKWYDYFTGQEIDISTTAQLLYMQAGEFHIFTDKKLPTPKAGLVSFSSKADILLSTEQNWLEQGISVFPNPTTESFKIVFEKMPTQHLKIELFDVFGKKLFEENAFLKQSFHLDLNHFPKATYLLKMQIGNEILRKKIVKN